MGNETSGQQAESPLRTRVLSRFQSELSTRRDFVAERRELTETIEELESRIAPLVEQRDALRKRLDDLGAIEGEASLMLDRMLVAGGDRVQAAADDQATEDALVSLLMATFTAPERREYHQALHRCREVLAKEFQPAKPEPKPRPQEVAPSPDTTSRRARVASLEPRRNRMQTEIIDILASSPGVAMLPEQVDQALKARKVAVPKQTRKTLARMAEGGMIRAVRDGQRVRYKSRKAAAE